MKRSVSSVALLIVLAGLCVPQSSTTYVTGDIRRVGDKLACTCGSCNNTVATCQMLECHYSSPARQKIGAMQKTGSSDQAIIDSFVKESGLAALAAPPAEGFNLLGWIMPFVALLLGLGMIVIYFSRLRKPAVPAQPAPAPVIDEKYRSRIEEEMAEMD